MRLFSLFLLIVILIPITHAQNVPESKDVFITADKTTYLDSLTLQERKKYWCNKIVLENGDSVKFIAGGGTFPLLITIPNADLLFLNYNSLPDSIHFSVYNLYGIYFLSIYLDENYQESELLTIKDHVKREDKRKYKYPYTVYIINANEMAELKSSPEIIVDP